MHSVALSHTQTHGNITLIILLLSDKSVDLCGQLNVFAMVFCALNAGNTEIFMWIYRLLVLTDGSSAWWLFCRIVRFDSE